MAGGGNVFTAMDRLCISSGTCDITFMATNICNMISAPHDRDVLLEKLHGGETAVCYYDKKSQVWRKREDDSEFLGVYKWEEIKDE